MRTLWIVVILCAAIGVVNAQQFEEKFRIDLPDSVQDARVRWADLDNDGFLDAIVAGTSQAGNSFLLTYQVDTVQGILFKSATMIPYANGSFVLADDDLDNDIDIFLSEDTTTTRLSNDGDFTFTVDKILEEGGAVAFGDLDEDGLQELVISGVAEDTSFLHIYALADGEWKLKYDSIHIAATALIILDVDGDGRNDLFVSGRDDSAAVKTTVFYNRGGLYFAPFEAFNAVAGEAVIGDVDEDGDFDILASVQNSDDGSRSLILRNLGDSLRAVADTLTTFGGLKFFVADLNSNGLADVHFVGRSSTDTLNVIMFDDSTEAIINSAGLIDQAFGDYDRDGDLDLLQVAVGSAGPGLILFSNDIPEGNGYPGRVSLPLTAGIFNRTFFYWEPPEDDHTPQQAITYDLTIHTEMEDRMLGEFDLVERTRLTVSHGNLGTNNFFLLRQALQSFSYRIQSIDNAFHVGADGLCVGTGGNAQGSGPGCDLIGINNLTACRNEQLFFARSREAMWFSFSDGFLGRSTILNFNVVKSDTLFSVEVDRDGDCGAVQVYLIEVQENVLREEESQVLACEGTALTFGVEPGWEEVTWESAISGFLSDSDTLAYTLLQNDTLSVTVTNSDGCGILRRYAISISKPEVTLNGEIFYIMQGSEVQLDAGDGGMFYQWVPSGGLSNDAIANPIASPSVTTEYTVTVTDSIGCTAVGKVLVVVTASAFVPNLFTPNGDGQNDELRVYGLASVKEFSFVVRNREGSVVYQTQDITAATTRGWNGAVQGNIQPAGVYYWQVDGLYLSGEPLLLNGKSKGTIVLIR